MRNTAPRKRLGLPFAHPAVLIATWFGTGLLPVTPGTWGSLAALPFAWMLCLLFGPAGLAAAALAVFIGGCWAAGRVARETPEADPGWIVIDEVAAQWLTLVIVPLDIRAYAAAFLLFRVADIVKPWPVSWADRRIGGGFGIMLDDVLAALYAMLGLILLMGIGALDVRR